MIILQINPQSRRENLIWEHVIKTIVGFFGFYALIIYITSGAGKVRNTSDETKSHIVDFFITYPWILIFGPILSVIAINIQSIINNVKKRYVIKIEKDESSNEYIVELISMYSNKLLIKRIENQHIFFQKKSEKVFILGTITFYELQTENGLIIGRVNPSNRIYSKQSKRIDQALKYFGTKNHNIINK